MSINIDAYNENIKTPVAVSSGTVETYQNSFATLLRTFLLGLVSRKRKPN